MREVIVFEEQVSSKWTTILFMALAIMFGEVAYWKYCTTGVNFLEYSRVLLTLKNKIGPIQNISFSTRNPDEIIKTI